VDYLNINGDASGSVSLTDAQASQLVGAGLVFNQGGEGADDHITLDASSIQGTHLSTSLKDLQKLGIDHVLVGTSDNLVVDYGNGLTGGINDGLNALNLPNFVATGDFNHDGVIDEKDINITLNLNENYFAQSLGNVEDIASALRSAGVDVVNTNINQDRLGLLTFDNDPHTNDLSALMAASTNSGLDFQLNVDVQLIDALSASGVASLVVEPNNHVSLSDSLARALVQSGMLSALPDTNLVLDATSSGNLIQTSLKDMAQIGVDSINLAASADGNKFYLNLGESLTDANAVNEFMNLIDEIDPSLKPLFSGNALATKALVLDADTAMSLTDKGVLNDSLVANLAKIGITEIDVVGTDASSLNISSTNDQVSVKLIGYTDDDYDYLYNYLHHK
jgi:hypothetical protein